MRGDRHCRSLSRSDRQGFRGAAGRRALDRAGALRFPLGQAVADRNAEASRVPRYAPEERNRQDLEESADGRRRIKSERAGVTQLLPLAHSAWAPDTPVDYFFRLY